MPVDAVMGRKLKLGMRKKPPVKRETVKEEAPVAAPAEVASPPRVPAQEPSLVPTRVPPSPAKLQDQAAAAWCREMNISRPAATP